jgi:hypothetical protein
MKTRQVTIEEIDQLFLVWFDYINASALYRQALREEMAVRDIDPHEFRDLLERAQERGYSFDDVVAETNRLSDLQELATDSAGANDENRPGPASNETGETAQNETHQ